MTTRVSKIRASMEASPKSVRFDKLIHVCKHFFGEPRISKSSHHVFSTPWQGDPRVNLQPNKNGKAKAYQVEQVLDAIRKKEENNG